jgi:quinol monooxygenase YgiN
MFVEWYLRLEARVIKHIVLWKLKDGALGATKAENAERLKREAAALAGVVPGLRSIELGINFEPSDAAWDVALYSEFDSREALDAYQVHPQHEAFRDLVAKVRQDRAVIDYQV